MWQTVYTARSESEAGSVLPTIGDIPAGSQVKIRIDLQPWAPVGKLADLAGAELWAQKLYPEMTVSDVYGDWHWIEIRGVAKGAFPIAIALIVFGVLALFGVAAWAAVSISADIREVQVAKSEYMEVAIRAGYTPAEAAEAWEKAQPLPGVALASGVAAGLGFGALLLIGVGAFLLLRK